jgi:Patatin-like phospholipase
VEHDQTGARHEVLRALASRAQAGSQPRARDDGLRIALAIEGGGMRGIISAGRALALHELGLVPAFDAVYGASAGAITGAWLLSRPEGLRGWAEPAYSRALIRRSAPASPPDSHPDLSRAGQHGKATGRRTAGRSPGMNPANRAELAAFLRALSALARALMLTADERNRQRLIAYCAAGQIWRDPGVNEMKSRTAHGTIGGRATEDD